MLSVAIYPHFASSCLWSEGNIVRADTFRGDMGSEGIDDLRAHLARLYGDTHVDSLRIATHESIIGLLPSTIGILRLSHPTAAAFDSLRSDGVSFPPNVAVVRWTLARGADFLGGNRSSEDVRNSVAVFKEIAGSGAAGLVIVGAGALASPAAERAVATEISEFAPALPILISQEIGAIGMRERESLAVQNLLMRPSAQSLVAGFQVSFPGTSIYVSTGFGEVTGGDQVCRLPAATAHGLLYAHIHGATIVAEGFGERVFFGEDWAVIALRAEVSERGSGNSMLVPTYEMVDSRISNQDPKRDAAIAEWRSTVLARYPDPRPTFLEWSADRPDEIEDLDRLVHRGLAEAIVVVRLVRAVYSRDEVEFHGEVAALKERLRTEAVRAGADPAQLSEPRVLTSPIPYLSEPIRLVQASLRGYPL